MDHRYLMSVSLQSTSQETLAHEETNKIKVETGGRYKYEFLKDFYELDQWEKVLLDRG